MTGPVLEEAGKDKWRQWACGIIQIRADKRRVSHGSACHKPRSELRRARPRRAPRRSQRGDNPTVRCHVSLPNRQGKVETVSLVEPLRLDF